jgi:hypothetical protein
VEVVDDLLFTLVDYNDLLFASTGKKFIKKKLRPQIFGGPTL